MQSFPTFPLAPRYRLDDESPWLEGIDPLRRYWLSANGDRARTAIVDGLRPESFEAFVAQIRQFRALAPGDRLTLGTGSNPATEGSVLCVSNNCYAVETKFEGAPVWHLFDLEALESLLMTAHPDWIPSDRDMALGRRMLERAMVAPAEAMQSAS